MGKKIRKRKKRGEKATPTLAYKIIGLINSIDKICLIFYDFENVLVLEIRIMYTTLDINDDDIFDKMDKRYFLQIAMHSSSIQ